MDNPNQNSGADIKALEERNARLLANAEDRIWADQVMGIYLGCDQPGRRSPLVEYVRADLYASAIAERDEARADAKSWRDAAFLSDCEAHSGQLDEMTARAEAAEARLEELIRERDEAIGLVNELDKFQNEVFGWLKSRGLVDDFDDEWDGFVSVIEEHETEIAAAAERPLFKRLEQAKAVLEPFGKYLDTAAFDLDNHGEPLPDDQGMGWVYLTIGDFRRARAFLHQGGSE